VMIRLGLAETQHLSYYTHEDLGNRADNEANRTDQPRKLLMSGT
jgi:hypothetical protein